MKTSKAKKYAVEQFLLQNEVICLLNLNQHGFYLCDIDENQILQNKIMDLVPEIRQYFCHVNITGLLYPERCKRPWLSIVRGILKNRYRLKYLACRHRQGTKSVFTMRYFAEPLKSMATTKSGKVTLRLSSRQYPAEKPSLSTKSPMEIKKFKLGVSHKTVETTESSKYFVKKSAIIANINTSSIKI